jgi:hypothetical protein
MECATLPSLVLEEPEDSGGSCCWIEPGRILRTVTHTTKAGGLKIGPFFKRDCMLSYTAVTNIQQLRASNLINSRTLEIIYLLLFYRMIL